MWKLWNDQEMIRKWSGKSQEMIRKWSGWCENMIRPCLFCWEKREGWKTWKTWLPHWDARGPTWLPPWPWQRSQHRRQARPGTWWLVAPGTWWLVDGGRPLWWMLDASDVGCEVPTSLTSPVRVAFQVLAQSDTVTNVLQNAHPVLICSNF